MSNNELRSLLPAEYFEKLSVTFSQMQSAHYASFRKLAPQLPQPPLAHMEEISKKLSQDVNRFSKPAEEILKATKPQIDLAGALPKMVEALSRLSFPTNEQFSELDAKITAILSSKDAIDPQVIAKADLPKHIKTAIDSTGFQLIVSLIDSDPIGIYAISNQQIIISLCEAMDGDEKNTILINNADEIVSGCKDLILHSYGAGGKTLGNFTLEAIETINDSHYTAAQALLTNILDTLISDCFPIDKQERKNKITVYKPEDMKIKDLKDAESHDLITALIWKPICVGHHQYRKWKADPIPNDYNRHASVHSVGIEQYSEANCLKALTLVTSLLDYRERRTIPEIVNAVDNL